MPNLSLSQAKGCCYVAYDGLKGQVYEFAGGIRWEILDVWTWSISGFKAMLMRQLGAGNVTVLAFAGTDSIRDGIADAAQVVGVLPMQYMQALQLTRRCQSSPNLQLTGHSLGGGLASYCAVETDVSATTINPAPLVAASSFSAWFMPNTHIVNYIAGGSEFVSSSPGVNPGRNVAVYAEGNFFSRHLLSNVDPRIPLPRRVTGAR